MQNGIVRVVKSVSVVCAVMTVGLTQQATAQSSASVSSAPQASDSALYAKAQQMVSNGDAAAGRAIIDSLIGVAKPGTPRYAEALYWRATLAGSAADAERSYRQIVVDYPLSPRVDDALLRMGQLELTRGDREAALQHFQRLTVEHADSPLRAKASYYLARAYLEKNDLKHACAANADALAHARASDVELRNQIDYQNQRCAGVATPAAVAQNGATQDASAAGAAAEEIPAVETPAVETPAPVAETPAADVETPASAPAPKPVKGKATAAKPAVKPVVKPIAKPAAKPVKATKPAKPAPAADVATEAPASDDAEAPAPAKSTTAKSGTFAVQVAAYYDKPQAEALATKLRGRGYPVHVDGEVAPFRVRIGHYETHAQAATALANLKAKRITGFVTQE